MSTEMRLETITPEKATDYLKKNKNNRPMSQSWANFLAGAIKSGEFVVNGESVKFDIGGNLIDGQHRCQAVIISNTPIKTYVARGLEPASYDTIDQGKKRTLGDTLAREGIKHYSTAASATIWIISIKNESKIGGASRFTNAQLHTFYNANPEISESVELVIRYRDFKFSRGMFAGLHFVFAQKDKKRSDAFIERVLGGVGLERDMPEYKLRNFLIKDASSVKQYRGDDICTAVVKMWNAVRQNKTVKCLKISPGESRPKVL